jgi:hypothetical protein
VCWSEKLEQFYKNQKREILTEEGKWSFRKRVFWKIGDTFQREKLQRLYMGTWIRASRTLSAVA